MHRVLFLCTANSTRSQMAEKALPNAPGGIGLQVHPMALAALQDLRIAVTDLAPKSLELFRHADLA